MSLPTDVTCRLPERTHTRPGCMRLTLSRECRRAATCATSRPPHAASVSPITCCCLVSLLMARADYFDYNLENWHNVDRHHFNAISTDQDIADTYLPAFESCVRFGRVSSLMCSCMYPRHLLKSYHPHVPSQTTQSTVCPRVLTRTP